MSSFLICRECLDEMLAEHPAALVSKESSDATECEFCEVPAAHLPIQPIYVAR